MAIFPLLPGAVAVLMLLLGASTASAHQTSLRARLIEVSGHTSPVQFGPKTSAKLSLSSGKGGEIKFKLSRAVDGTGAKITAPGNILRLEVNINDVPQTLEYAFDISNGTGKVQKERLGLVKPDVIQILAVEVEDQGGEVFAALGFSEGTGGRALTSAMVQVNEGSQVLLAPSRDADVTMRAKNGGEFAVHFDKLKDAGGNPINLANNSLELELSLNGGAPELRTFSFDIVNDSGEVEADLGLVSGDLLEVIRIDAFDPNDNRFSTLGVRIQNPKP